MEKQSLPRDVQRQVYDRVVAQMAEHFDCFVVIAVPGGGGEPLSGPSWSWNGNRVILTGAVELAKLDIAACAERAGKTHRGGKS